MSFQTPRSRFFKLRAFLVFAALISLCVSKNVGPQFLPLPGLSDQVGESQLESERNAASRFPSSESDNFRVPMVGQTHKRAGTELQSHPLATAALRSAFEQPVDVQTTSDWSCAILLFTWASVSQPPGRAPPALI
jgi:hypothetical protein